MGLAGCLNPTFIRPTVIPDGPAVRLKRIAGGFTYPTDMVELPDGSGSFFLTDQPGIVHHIDAEHDVSEAVDLTDRVIDIGDDFDERGLLGIACHPDFESNGRVFVRYSAIPRTGEPSGWNTEVLAEFESDGDTIDPASERQLLRIPQPSVIHQGGSVLFGPDGYLYTTTGDGGRVPEHREEAWLEEHDPNWYEENTGSGSFSQTTTDNLLGGVLRIDVDTESNGRPYGIPPDNPLVGLDGHRDEYYAWGMRNPWGAAFDGETLYVADVGQALFEIVNLVERGGNYGWNIREGTHCYDEEASRSPHDDCPERTPDEVRGGEELLDPLIEYPQYVPQGDPPFDQFDFDTQHGSAIIGGAIYRGSVDALDGAYVCGDWSKTPHGDPNGQLFLARPRDELDAVHEYFEQLDLWGMERIVVESNDGVATDGQLNRYVASMATDLDGEMYALVTETPNITGETGEIRKLVPP